MRELTVEGMIRENDALAHDVIRLQADYLKLADAIAPSSTGVDELVAEVRRLGGLEARSERERRLQERVAELEAGSHRWEELQLETVRERDEALARLPEDMKHCTIIFKECEKGHGRLTAANWVQRDCHWCALAKARADFLACAQAIGVSYEADGRDSAPGPVDEVVKHITEARHAGEDIAEWQAWAEDAASIGLDLTDPEAVLPDDDRRVLIRESLQEFVVVCGAERRLQAALDETRAQAAALRHALEAADGDCSGEYHDDDVAGLVTSALALPRLAVAL